jgi:enterochelin esterase family protein
MSNRENRTAKFENRSRRPSFQLRVSNFTCLLVLLCAAVPARAGRAECGSKRSEILDRTVKYCAILPPSYDTEKTRRYPILYWLHGLGENEQTFVDFGGWNLVEILQEKKQIGEYIIVIPDGGRSFYVNSRSGRVRYEDFFIREFLPAMEKKFRVKPGRASRGIAGVSMGGYGALRLAFKFPELFSAVSVHSAALLEKLPRNLPTQSRSLQTRLLIFADVFGMPVDPQYWEENNPIHMARTAAGLQRLKIYFDCGTEDEYGFDRGARVLSDVLKGRGIAHEFHLYPGGHGWSYLAEHAAASFTFHSRTFSSAGN